MRITMLEAQVNMKIKNIEKLEKKLELSNIDNQDL